MGLPVSFLVSLVALSGLLVFSRQVFFLEWQEDKQGSGLNRGSVSPPRSVAGSLPTCRTLGRVPLIHIL